jgi:hypothetical protein
MTFSLIGIDAAIESHGLKLPTGKQVDSFLVAQMYNFRDIARRFPAAFELITQIRICAGQFDTGISPQPLERHRQAHRPPPISSVRCHRRRRLSRR